ncbi:hypothetical protein BZA05DRAFT_415291 [Tricharina praecox]|uniref:uncharacterized protein n=1 Tax=Tricharina praecox TaxID=43433 RepID=UPI00221F468E|nr:uncharacterized protein BZA05DRAFT_415291 [Tricharina praecox]KAI5857906.1 hypothetical protein BZA05DRAFT_415291 [Tricharina praecox]
MGLGWWRGSGREGREQTLSARLARPRTSRIFRSRASNCHSVRESWAMISRVCAYPRGNSSLAYRLAYMDAGHAVDIVPSLPFLYLHLHLYFFLRRPANSRTEAMFRTNQVPSQYLPAYLRTWDPWLRLRLHQNPKYRAIVFRVIQIPKIPGTRRPTTLMPKRVQEGRRG